MSLGKDAATTNLGMLEANTELRLIIPKQVVEVEKCGKPARASFKLLADAESVPCVCVNRGRFKRGYLIDKKTGELVSKHRAEHGDDKWLEGRTRVMRSAIACRSNAAVWICAIPCTYEQIAVSEFLQTLIRIALQVEAADRLHVDSRSIPSYVQIQDKSVLFCLYDTKGASGYLRELDNKKYEVLSSALDRIKKSRTSDGRIANLLNYATERDLSCVPEQVFELAANWAEKYSECLTKGCYDVVDLCGNPVEVEAISSVDNPLLNSEGKQVIILSLDWKLYYLNETSFLKKILGRNKAGSVHVVVGSLNKEPEPIQIEARNAMCAWMAAYGNLKFYEVDFDADGLRDSYEQGLRFMVDASWYMTPEGGKSGNILLSENAEKILSNTYRIVDGMVPGLNLNPGGIVKKMEMPLSYKPFCCHKGMLYSQLPAREILARLGIAREDAVSKIEVIDPYFTSLTNWKTFWLLLKEMRFLPTARIAIRAWNPERKGGFNAYLGYYNFWKGAEFTKVDCCTPIQKALHLDDAQNVATWMRNKLKVNDVNIAYEDKSPSHDRFMIVSYIDEVGKEHKARIALGKGFSFLDFRPARSIPLFNDKADASAAYTDDLTFCRIEEK